MAGELGLVQNPAEAGWVRRMREAAQEGGTDTAGALKRAALLGLGPVGAPLEMQRLAKTAAAAEQAGSSELPALSPQAAGRLEQQLAALAGAGQQQAAAAPAMVRLTNSATTTQAPALAPAVAQQQMAETRQLGEAKEAAIGERQAVLDSWGQALDRDRQLYGDRARVLYGKMEAAGQDLARMREEIESAEIDPDRAWREAPATQKVIGMLAMAFSHYMPGGVQAALGVIQRGIDQDVARQRGRIDRLIRSHRMGREQQEMVYRQWSQIEGQRRGVLQRMSALELAKATAGEQKIDARIQAADTVRKLAQLSTPRSTTTTTTRDVPMAPEGADPTKTPPNTVIASSGAAVETLGDIDEAISKIRKDGYGRWAREIPDSEQQRVKDLYLSPLVRSIASAVQKGALSDKDVKPFENMLLRKLTSGPEVVRRLATLKAMMVRRAAARLQANSAYFDVKPLAAQLAPFAKGLRPVNTEGLKLTER